jgi:autotransporter-associated beta strand protein
MNTIQKVAALGVLAVSFAQCARADITTGLVGYWSLSDGPGHSTVADLSGNGNTGTLKNFSDATFNNMWTTSSDPNNGWPNAMLFNQSGEGTDDYISIPDAPSLDGPSTGTIQWTISAWVNCSVAGGSEPANAGIVTKGVISGTAYEYCLYMTGGKFACAFRNNPNTGGEVATSQTVPLANTWYHVVGVVHIPRITVAPSTQGSEAWIYVNGVQEYGTNANTYTTMLTNTTAVTIGCFGAGVNPFEGTIDEVRIYNRELPASDVLQLYQNKANPVINSGVGYWNGLAGTGGNATLDTTSLNFDTNALSAPIGTPASLSTLLGVESASSISPNCVFADSYYSSSNAVAIASSNITIAAGGVAIGNASGAGTMTFQNGAVTYSLASSDSIGLKDGANPTSLSMSGIGTLIMTGVNTYSGGTVINLGTIQLGNGGATGSPLGSAGVTDNASLVFLGNDSPTVNNIISGAGSVAQKGPGTLTLNSANTYTGTTVLSNGTLQAASLTDGTSTIGASSITLAGGTLNYTGSGDNTTRVVNGVAGTTSGIGVGSGVNLEFTGRVTSSAAWTVNKTGAGTLTLSGNGDNSFLGMNVNGGTLVLNKLGTSIHAIGNPLVINSGGLVQFSPNGYTLQIASNASSPVTINSGGAMDMNGTLEGFSLLSLGGTGLGGSGALTNSAGSGATLGVPNVNLASAATIGGAGGIVFPGVIAGAGPLTFAGTSSSVVFQLQNFNTYSGGTFVNSGTLDASGVDSIPGNVTVAGTGVLQLDTAYALAPTATITLPASPAAGTVNLNFTGTQNIGALVLGATVQPAGTYGASGSGANYTSAVFIGGGILNVMETYWDANHTDASSSSSANGGGSGSWDNSATNWWVAGSADTTWPANNVAYFGGTPGTVTLNAPESVFGMVFLTPGYNVKNTDGTSALTVTGNNPVVSVPSGTTSIGCNIAGGGTGTGLTASGPGTLVLSGTNTYTGTTEVTNGATLSVNSISDSGVSAIGTGNVVAYGGALSYTGVAPATTARNVNAYGASSNIIDVAPGAGVLTVNGQMEGTTWIKTSSGTLILGGSADNAGLGIAINAGEVIITKASATNVHGLGGAPSSVANGAELQLAGSGNYDLYSGCTLTVASGGVFDLNGQSDNMSTLTISGAGAGSGALLNTSATASSLTNGGSGVVLSGATTVGGIGNITLNSVVSGGGSITYAGSAVLSLTNANTFGGGIVINPSATVLLTNSASSGGAGSIVDNGTLDLALTANNAQLTNPISGPGIVNIMETAAANLQISGSMSGFTGTINCPTSPGSTAKFQILSTGVGLTATPTINVAAGGTFYVSGSNVVIPCPINLYGVGNSEAYGALRLENNCVVSGPVILHGNTTMGNGQASAAKFATISGPIVETNGSFGVAFTAEPGTIVLTGSNTFTGGVTISNGIITVGGAGCLGANGGAPNFAANITNSGALVFNTSAAQTLSGVVSGAGQLAQEGPATLTLVNTNTFTGPVTISNSTLLISGGGCLGVTAAATNFTGSISNFGTLNYSSSAAQILSGVISGNGVLVQNGSGLLTLSNTEMYTGNTAISAGTLTLASAGSINNSTALSIAAGATFDVSAFSLSYNLGATALNASGTGIGVGTTAATIKGSPAATVSVGSTTLGYSPQSFTGDLTHPALYVSQGALNLTGSGLTVSNATGTALGAGTYTLVQVAGGNLTVASTNVTVTGKGLAAGGTASLAVSGGNLNLVVVVTSISTPAINNVSFSGQTVFFSGTNGPASRNYTVLTSTNLSLPLSNWTVLSTNAFGPSGTFTASNTPSASPSFYIIKVQ